MDSEDECIGIIMPLDTIKKNQMNITYGNCSNQYICNVPKYHSNKNYENVMTESLLLDIRKNCEIIKSKSEITNNSNKYQEYLAKVKHCKDNYSSFIENINSKKVESLYYLNNLKTIYNNNIEDFNNTIETFNYDIPTIINESNMRSTCIDSTSTSSSNNTSEPEEPDIEIGICNSTQRLKIYIVEDPTIHTNILTPPLSNSPIGMASISIIHSNSKLYNRFFINKLENNNLNININQGNQNSSLKLYRNIKHSSNINCQLDINDSDLKWNLHQPCFTITTDKLGENINHTLTITFN